MRKKPLKTMSLALAIAVSASGLNPGMVTYAAPQEETQAVEDYQQEAVEDSFEEEQATDEDAAEDESESEETVQTDSEEEMKELTLEEKVAKRYQETNEAVEEDTTEEYVPQKVNTLDEYLEATRVETEDDQIQLDATVASPSTKLSTIGMDAAMLEYLAGALNKSQSDLTVKDLNEYTGDIDTTQFAKASSIASMEGLQYAKSVSNINLSKTSIKEVPSRIFVDNSVLESITLPASVKKIGDSAFENCSKLEHVNTYNNGTVTDDRLPLLDEAGQKSFMRTLIKSISFDANDTAGIAYQNATSMFAYCSELSSVDIGNQVAYIPTGMFMKSGGEMGMAVRFGTGITKIGSDAFREAKFEQSAEGINLSKCATLEEIGDNAFIQAEGFNVVKLPADSGSASQKLVIKDNVFAGTPISAMYSANKTSDIVAIPNYVTSLGKSVFSICPNITAVEIPAKVEALDDYLFDQDIHLASVTIAANSKISLIGDCAFRNTAITNTDFMKDLNNLKVIGRQHLDEITVEKGIAKDYLKGDRNMEDRGGASLPAGGFNVAISIDENGQKSSTNTSKQQIVYGSETFSDCKYLTSITIPKNVTSIGSKAFSVNLLRLKSPTSNDKDAYGQLLAKGTPTVTSVNWLSGGTAAKRVIHTAAFMGNQNLSTITLPNNTGDTIEIDNFAFVACGFFDIDEKGEGSGELKINQSSGKNVLPKSVTKIGDGAFLGDRGLKSIVIQATESGACPTLGEASFQNCDSMTYASLPDSVTEVANHMFYSNPLQSYPISKNAKNLKRIGRLAFMENEFTSVDLSNCKQLTEMGAGAFSYLDAVASTDYSDSFCSKIKKTYGNNEPIKFCDSLKEVILPDTLEGTNTLFMNTAQFYGHIGLTTIKTPSNNVNDRFFVPSYAVQGDQQALFACTGVSKCVWQNDITGSTTNLWKTIPYATFELCENIVNAEDVLPTKDYVENIGKLCFADCNIVKADLSKYVKLQQISRKEDRTTGNIKYVGAFANCVYLQEVYLPYTTGDTPLKIQESSFAFENPFSLNPMTICFGNATSIGDKAFANNGNVAAETYVDSANTSKYAAGDKTVVKNASNFVLPNSVTEIGNNAFENCTGLTDVQFTMQNKIGNYCFQNCSSIQKLTFAPALSEIPNRAFSGCKSIEDITFNGQKIIGNDAFRESFSEDCTVVFDSALEEIKSSAFDAAKTKEYVFSNASNLQKIGDYAFRANENLTTFELEGTKVEKLTYTLQNCKSLESVSFGPEVKSISKSTVTRAPWLSKLKISASTTIDKEIFKGTSSTNNGAPTASESGNVTVEIRKPEPFVVPLNRFAYLPYAINKVGESSFKTILIGGAEDTNNPDIQNLMKITGMINEGAYWGSKAKDGNNDKYSIKTNFTKAAVTQSVLKESVDAIQLDGLKEGSTTITLEATLKLMVEVDGDPNRKEKEIETPVFNVVYDVSVEPVLVYSDLTNISKDVNLNLKANKNHAFQATAKNYGRIQVSYAIRPAIAEVTTAVDTYDVVVTSSNPDVMIPGENASSTYNAKTGCVIKTTNSNGVVDTNKMKFYLVAKKPGTAKITVYPVGHADAAQTYTFTVGADISSYTLKIPEQYMQENSATGLKKGISFNILDSYKNVLNGEYLAGDKTKPHCSNMANSIKYTSSDPSYVSVDKTGKITVLKESEDGVKNVTIEAVLRNSDGVDIKRSLSVRIKEAAASLNAAVKDTSGVTYVPTVEPKNGQPGEVTYRLPADNQTSVSIPSVVTIKKNQYNVTKIDVNAFKNNKKITSVTIGNNVKSIPANAFMGCSALTNVNISNSVTTIGTNAFYGCTKLQSINIPDSVTSIGAKAFYGCKKLIRVSFTSNSKLTTIGNSAFQKCSTLPSFTIPKKVKKLGTNTFYSCKKLKEIKIESTKLTKVGKKSFKGTNKNLVISVPNKKYKKYKKLLKSKGQNKKAKIVKY